MGVGLLIFGLSLALIALRMPVGVAMLLMGGIGFVCLAGWDALLNTLETTTYSRFANYTMSVIPLFLMMGQFATKAGMNLALFRAARAWFGHWRGGLAIATIGGCAAFGAICGSSLATAATMAQVAQPEMRRYGYSDGLGTGTLAAGGTLGILIPPSVILVIYAILTEQSVGHLFLAAIVPGLLATVGYMIVVAIYVRVAPLAGPAVERLPWKEKIASLKEIWPVALVFCLVVGGIYAGWFSPTEGAGIGAASVGLIAVVFGKMRWQGLRDSLLDTAVTTAMIFLILLGAELFGTFLALSQMPNQVATVVSGLELSPMMVIVAMLLIYLLLGCVMDSLAMILLTLPVFIPVVYQLDLGIPTHQVAIWFGIVALIAVEVGLITPPIGMNLFVINAIAKDVPMSATFLGALPFVISDIVRVALILAFPALCLYLPELL